MDLNLNLKGRLALVTGSTRGLGKAIAMALAQEGAGVIINGRGRETVLKTMEEISNKCDVKTWSCFVDVTDGGAIKNFFRVGRMAAKGKLDILINNAGNLEKFGSFAELNDLDWAHCFALTFMSAVRFIREALPFLERSGHGRIINISSLTSHQPGYFNPHYSAAKAALNNLTKHLANTLGEKNILVNAICPSTLAGGGWNQNIKNRAKRDGRTVQETEFLMRGEEEQKSPLRRMGGLEDVVNLVVYLASDQAKFLTGHIYDVDGGITKGI